MEQSPEELEKVIAILTKQNEQLSHDNAMLKHDLSMAEARNNALKLMCVASNQVVEKARALSNDLVWWNDIRDSDKTGVADRVYLSMAEKAVPFVTKSAIELVECERVGHG